MYKFPEDRIAYDIRYQTDRRAAMPFFQTLLAIAAGDPEKTNERLRILLTEARKYLSYRAGPKPKWPIRNFPPPMKETSHD